MAFTVRELALALQSLPLEQQDLYAAIPIDSDGNLGAVDKIEKLNRKASIDSTTKGTIKNVDVVILY